jgi:hypothetical protein
MNITSMAVSEMESSELSDLLKEAGGCKNFK